jgi:hypothetical protein
MVEWRDSKNTVAYLSQIREPVDRIGKYAHYVALLSRACNKKKETILNTSIKFVPHSKHAPSRLLNQLMLRKYKKNSLCGKNVKFLNVKPCGSYSYHCALNGYALHTMVTLAVR